MKVTLEREYRRMYTLEELDQAKVVIREEKEDQETPKGWAEYAAREALQGTGDYLREVLTAEARTAKNGRIWEQYGEGSGQMDVWIEALCRTADGFLELGAYLSDIWQTGAVPYSKHLYAVRYTRA